MRALIILAALAVFLSGEARAHSGETLSKADFNADKAIEISGNAIGGKVGDYRLYNRHGRPVRLSSFRGKPLVISLIYTSCAHTCPIVTRNLARVVDEARDFIGKDGFAVASIGFDTRNDKPGRMRIFAKEQGIAGVAGWSFLSGDHDAIDALVRDLGFVYFRTPKGFDHVTQTTVLDTEGRVYRQIYGTTFDAQRLVEPLKRLAIDGGKGVPTTFSGLIDRVRLFCTVYDPARDRYRFDYSIVVAAAVGIICLGALCTFIVHAWRSSRPPGAA